MPVGYSLKISDYLTIIKNGIRYSNYIYPHSIETGNLAYLISREFISDNRADLVRKCGYLHDIGKIAIPLTILEKPSNLNPEEKEIMDKHVEIGVYILNQYGLYEESKIISQHHERVDGSGYPEGLAGNSIMLESRILGLCDVYTALTVNRPYRNKLTAAQALDIIRKERHRYDPAVTEAIAAVLENNSLKKLYLVTANS